MRGWVILIGTFLVGLVVGVGVANRGSALIASYFPNSASGAGEHVEGQVVRKQREGNRLLVKVITSQGPMLVIPHYATFIEDPVFERIKAPAPAKAPG
jgi:hypothetical protein